MDKTFIEKQKNIAYQYFSRCSNEEKDNKNAVSIIVEYLSSLIDPEKYTEAQREDIRKLALELGYKEDVVFDDWVSKFLEKSE